MNADIFIYYKYLFLRMRNKCLGSWNSISVFLAQGSEVFSKHGKNAGIVSNKNIFGFKRRGT